ncbi:MAG: BACON domain-containing protein [Prevotella sp.]|jgi:hypothetical protein|nr:BACON domain-containing protein [Prevotella sp.]
MKHYILYILLILTFASCDQSEEPEVVKSEEIDIPFSLNIPEASDVSLKSSDDNSIRSIDLLMFDASNNFLQRIQVNNVSGAGAVKTFNVRLAATAQARTFHVIANGRDQNSADIVNFSTVTPGMTQSTAIPALKTNMLAANSAPELPLIMWGRVTLPGITPTTTTGTIDMLRTVASIRTECATPTASNGMNDFSLAGFTVLKTSNMGKVAPNAYTDPAVTPSTVSLISGSAHIDYTAASGTGIWANATSNSTPELYVYERSNVLDNTGLSVIIRASYKGVDGYYKVWLKNNLGQVIHIVRNHRYIIQISKVSGAGYQTLQEAMNATHSSNIFVEISDNDDDITDIIVDSTYKLGISSNAITITGSGEQSIGAALKTNTSATLSISSNVSWITNGGYTSQPNNRYAMKATFGTTTVSRNGTITVRAGNLTRTITVTQNP